VEVHRTEKFFAGLSATMRVSICDSVRGRDLRAMAKSRESIRIFVCARSILAGHSRALPQRARVDTLGTLTDNRWT